LDKSEYKKYKETASRGIKGEAFFESLICEHTIPHHVVGPKDIGIDYFCEWVCGDRSTGILFAAQVKTVSETTVQPEFVEVERKYNGLDKFNINYSYLKIKLPTLLYWQSLGIPTYVFVVVQGATDDGRPELVCYYKRYTHLLTVKEIEANYSFSTDYYRVSDGSSFIAYLECGIQGFARDLFIDHVRWTYHKGSIAYPDPRSFGLKQIPVEGFFIDLFPSYKEQILLIYERTKKYLEEFERRASKA
jgi:hypothetical protein